MHWNAYGAAISNPWPTSVSRRRRPSRKEHGMATFYRRVFQARSDVVRFQIRNILKNFRLRNAGSQQFQHILHTDAQTSDARAPPRIVWD